jgi:hypothetical protein
VPLKFDRSLHDVPSLRYHSAHELVDTENPR